jgi:hypothetical protein
VCTVITGQQDAGKRTNKVNGTAAIAARQEAGTQNDRVHADAAIAAARDHNDTASGGEGSTQPDDGVHGPRARIGTLCTGVGKDGGGRVFVGTGGLIFSRQRHEGIYSGQEAGRGIYSGQEAGKLIVIQL